ncbi:hypothetical protein B0A49_12963, partial [Cryomyces minteri]
FLVPCPGCLGAQEGDEAFVLELQAFASEAECGVSNVTLNGRTLTQEWYATHANGQGLLSSFVGSQEYALDLSWETSCLLAGHSAQDTAQLLNVNIDRVNGVAVDTRSGFRLSYKQLPRAELLRLSTVKETSVEAPVFAEDWRDPPDHLRLSPPASEQSPEATSRTSDEDQQRTAWSIEEEIEDLKRLQAEVKALNQLIRQKTNQINSHMKQEAKNLKADIKQCDSVNCAFKAVFSKAHSGVKVLYAQLQSGCIRGPGADLKMGSSTERTSENNTPELELNRHDRHPNYPMRDEHEGLFHAPPPPHVQRPRPSYQPNPATPLDTLYDPIPPINGEPSPMHAHPFLTATPHPSPLKVVLAALLTFLGITALFTLLHHRFSSLRARTDRRAAREERRTARQYRCHARRHAWREWWAGRRRCRWFGGSGIGGGDYEEKRALILAQEGVLEAAMQAEIRALREAALRGGAGVGELATAEEGRMPRTFVANTILHGSPNPNLSMYQSGIGVGVGQPLSRTSSLPSYATEAPSLQPDFNTSTPPPYTANPHHHHHHHHLRPPLSSPFSHADDAAEADSDIVTDGFRQYAPTSSADADADADIDDLDVPWTPESSIPDLSPRQSGETDRTVVSAWERV